MQCAVANQRKRAFPALGTGCMFSRAWNHLQCVMRLVPVVYFPARGTGYPFSCAWYPLDVFASSSDWFIALFEFVVIVLR